MDTGVAPISWSGDNCQVPIGSRAAKSTARNVKRVLRGEQQEDMYFTTLYASKLRFESQYLALIPKLTSWQIGLSSARSCGSRQTPGCTNGGLIRLGAEGMPWDLRRRPMCRISLPNILQSQLRCQRRHRNGSCPNWVPRPVGEDGKTREHNDLRIL